MCLGTGEFLWPQRLLPGAPKRGCRRGRRYFWPCWTRVGFGPLTGPTIKTALCHIRALVGRIINNQVLGSFLSSCWVAFGRPFYLWAVLSGVSRHWRVPPASGAHPPKLLFPRGVRFIAWGLRRPQKGNADGVESIFDLAGPVWASALRRTHLKNGLVPYSCVGGTYD